jgi:hypothetical protein
LFSRDFETITLRYVATIEEQVLQFLRLRAAVGRILIAEHAAAKAPVERVKGDRELWGELGVAGKRYMEAIRREHEFTGNGIIPEDIGQRLTPGCVSSAMTACHISVDDLQRYHLGHVHEPEELSKIEEHLLWCQQCLDRVEAVKRFVDLLRAGVIPGGFDRNMV